MAGLGTLVRSTGLSPEKLNEQSRARVESNSLLVASTPRLRILDSSPCASAQLHVPSFQCATALDLSCAWSATLLPLFMCSLLLAPSVRRPDHVLNPPHGSVR